MTTFAKSNAHGTALKIGPLDGCDLLYNNLVSATEALGSVSQLIRPLGPRKGLGTRNVSQPKRRLRSSQGRLHFFSIRVFKNAADTLYSYTSAFMGS